MPNKYDDTMMDTAKLWAKHGTCSRLSVGCVMAKEERILVQGYNGAPKGLPHCDHECDCGKKIFVDAPNADFRIDNRPHRSDCKSGPGGCQAVHAEQNAIAWAARIGVALVGATCYCTHQPCLVCARLIITTGIERVVYTHPYRLEDGLDLLKEAKLSIEQLDWKIDFNTYAQLPLS